MKLPHNRIRPIPIHFPFDTDRDGVQDRHDCQWWNPQKQHITPSTYTKERLKKTPFYVTSEDMKIRKTLVKIPETYRLTSKAARQHAPQAVQEIHSIIKAYPGVLSEIERQQPKRISYTSAREKAADYSYAAEGNLQVFVKSLPSKQYQPLHEERTDFKEPLEKKSALSATAFFHELKHVEQEREGRLPEERSEYRKYKNIADSPWEQEAMFHEGEKMVPYFEPRRKPTGRQLTRILELD